MREMKDSGIGWVHEIPSNWTTIRGKYVFTNDKFVVGAKVEEYERLALTMNGVIKRSKEDNEGLQPDKFDTYQILKPDELVFKLIDLQNISTSRVGLSPYTGIVSPAYIILKSKDNIFPAFAEKYYLMMWMNQVFNALGDAGVRSSLNATELLELWLPLPPYEEQKSIASFLDKECAKIDEIMADVQSQIDTLEEYKKSVISEAVTKGLNPNVELKSTDVSWASKIPSHWSVMPNKYIMKKIKRICAIHKDEDIISLSMYGVIVRDLDAGGKMPTTFDGYQFVYPGNLLMCLFDYDVTPRCIGYINNYGVTSPAYSQFEMIDGMDAKYYYYYYLMIDNTKELLHLAKNLRHSFTEDELGKINQIVPPYQEQRAIADYLDKKCADIDSVIADKKSQLDTLEEYKKSLIYEYVTGKKEVPAV
ncbi:MAG: restriction endonuclease subunit S [Clostridiales bacterium]|nr:restriction endonuclease subunit S [Clostridiales bacterium]